jgi:hypothetical protein
MSEKFTTQRVSIAHGAVTAHTAVRPDSNQVGWSVQQQKLSIAISCQDGRCDWASTATTIAAADNRRRRTASELRLPIACPRATPLRANHLNSFRSDMFLSLSLLMTCSSARVSEAPPLTRSPLARQQQRTWPTSYHPATTPLPPSYPGWLLRIP